MNDNKHELTEKLKVIETDINNGKLDLRSIQYKLDVAYKYEDDLALRMQAARTRTSELQKQYFEKSSEISEHFRKMKSIFDIFTGNFYKS